jgi:hypothetical protein
MFVVWVLVANSGGPLCGLFGWLLSLVLASSPAPGIEETLPRVKSRAGSCSGGSVGGMGEQAADSDKSSRRLVGGMGEQAADSDKSSRRLLRRIGLADWVGGLESKLPTVTSRAGACFGGLGLWIGEKIADSDKSNSRLLCCSRAYKLSKSIW